MDITEFDIVGGLTGLYSFFFFEQARQKVVNHDVIIDIFDGELLGGRISISSSPGEGTRFEFTISVHG